MAQSIASTNELHLTPHIVIWAEILLYSLNNKFRPHDYLQRGESDMKSKERIIEGKQERQQTMDKLSIKNSQAYTYDKENGSGCHESAKQTTESNERKEDR